MKLNNKELLMLNESFLFERIIKKFKDIPVFIAPITDF